MKNVMDLDCKGNVKEWDWSEKCEGLGLQGKIGKIWIVVRNIKEWDCSETCGGFYLE